MAAMHGEQQPQLRWNGEAQHLPEGLYLVRLQTRDAVVLTQKVNYIVR